MAIKQHTKVLDIDWSLISNINLTVIDCYQLLLIVIDYRLGFIKWLRLTRTGNYQIHELKYSTSVKIYPFRPPARLLRAKFKSFQRDEVNKI